MCAAHRTLRDGSYVCEICEESAVAAAIAARARSHHRILLWGNIGAVVLLLAVLGIALGRPEGPKSGLARYAHDPSFVVLTVAGSIALLGLFRTRAFRVGRLDTMPAAERVFYWASAIPALVVFSVLFVVLAFLGVWSQREARVNRDAEAVRRGVNRALDER